MSSRGHSDHMRIDLEIPTSRDDVVALREARHLSPTSLAEALEQLSQLELELDPPARTRTTSAGVPEFVL